MCNEIGITYSFVEDAPSLLGIFLLFVGQDQLEDIHLTYSDLTGPQNTLGQKYALHIRESRAPTNTLCLSKSPPVLQVGNHVHRDCSNTTVREMISGSQERNVKVEACQRKAIFYDDPKNVQRYWKVNTINEMSTKLSNNHLQHLLQRATKGGRQKGIGHFFCFGHVLVTFLSLF